jgi:hypothetical protein
MSEAIAKSGVQVKYVGPSKMRNAQQLSMKNKCDSTNHFNDSEYNRWSQRLKAIKSSNPQSGIENFLGTTDSLQADHANICVPLDGDWQKMKKGRITSMALKLREWKRAVERLHTRCKSMVVELISVVGDEETKIARMELDSRSDCITAGRVREVTE